MKTLSKLVLITAFAASISACGALSGATGGIVIKPGCLIFCGYGSDE